MEIDNDTERKPVRGAPSRTARYEDAVVGLVAIVAAGLLFWATFHFRAVNWTPLGLAFWPRIILAGIVLTAVILIVFRQFDQHSPFQILRPEMTLFAAIAGFVAALPVLGFFATGVFYTFVTILWLDQEKALGPMKAALLAGSATAVTYAVFGFGLRVWLPVGVVGSWLGF